MRTRTKVCCIWQQRGLYPSRPCKAKDSFRLLAELPSVGILLPQLHHSDTALYCALHGLSVGPRKPLVAGRVGDGIQSQVQLFCTATGLPIVDCKPAECNQLINMTSSLCRPDMLSPKAQQTKRTREF